MGSVPMSLTICEMLTREHNNVTRAEWSTGAIYGSQSAKM